jgi:serine/threonine-protein phosphatase 6 regulatory subunit 3
MQLDELPSGAGVLEVRFFLKFAVVQDRILCRHVQWLSSERLVGRLIDLLSPAHSSDIHTIVSDLIKAIISMASPSPGAGLTEGLQNGPASNRFARELAYRDNVSKLVDYILADYGPDLSEDDTAESDADESSSSITVTMPNPQSSASSVVHSISIIIELIRKNNSDYFEPYLFHTLRNRLIQVQQHLQARTEDGRETLERAMKEMVDRMGVVHLGSVLEIMCERLDVFQKYLRQPRSMVSLKCV